VTDERSSRSRRARSTLRALSTVLIISGTLLVADAAATVAWQEPLSALLARISQDKLAKNLDHLEQRGATPLELRALAALPTDSRRLAFLARSLKRRAADGSAVGRISIPRIGARFVIVKGTGTADLRKGPGMYPETPFPGVPQSTTAIAGHRTTYLAPFRRIDELKRGDAITVTMPYGRFTYDVDGTRIVAPSDVAVIRPVGHAQLVLTACHPLYSAAKRIVVFARLVSTTPLAAARAG
jgi:sortase A